MTLIEVRWHGRGGQGVVTASELLANAAIFEGKYAQHFPEFGPERAGAPVRAYTRISDEPIELHTGIYEPDIVVVIDPTLLVNMDILLSGLKRGGVFVINISEPPSELKERCKELGAKLYYVDATKIALEIFKRPFFNTPMLGALLKATGIVKLESVHEAVKRRFKPEIAELNIKAISRAFEEVRSA
ncbi:MAG: pyruvate synthase [Thermoprotei archaeon]|nr:MAG: pyruvate synthase [Thermoprotei archaeon]